ncbi:PP2C family protein-serine/threonine phosphatase [Streptomyces botrytidirepellens]|uniref:Mucin-2 n=1 Tax=Streptomyces botrytidirepellens TaxID=2486417 RepID=A0A3M8WF11_9ACTN|nr:mucin-2 [Streptomyces botrytidirepellens]RNG27165.1 mucin-2 [Streptomyces botrytidirepellens]
MATITSTAQQLGDRAVQCDATGIYTQAATGARSYVLLDGIGTSTAVQRWTRTTARRLARAAATGGDAYWALLAEHARIRAEPDRQGYSAWMQPGAVAVIALALPGHLLQIAWCGDARAYLRSPDALIVRCLTSDHNQRRQKITRGETVEARHRHVVTSYLGHSSEEPLIGSVTAPAEGRLVLVSDGTYEPLEATGHSLAGYLDGTLGQAAHDLTAAAVQLAWASGEHPDNATALVADLD